MASKARPLALAILAASLGSAGSAMQPGVAAAQTCQIMPPLPSGVWQVPARRGEVTAFGDLKVRVVSSAFYSDSTDPLVVDMKAPGFAVSNVSVPNHSSRRFTICGLDVTLTHENLSGSFYSISVF